MATLRLEQLQCIRTDDPYRDEIRVTVTCDGRGTAYDSGERNMHDQDSQSLATPDGIPFTDTAVIRLRERDATRTKTLGSISIRYPFPVGQQTQHLPSVISGRHAPYYRLTYHVDADAEDAARPRNRIELLSLRCDDAQGAHDRVSLYLNEEMMWGPGNMWTNTIVDFGDELRFDFHSSITVRLHESRGETWDSAFTLRPGEADYVINTARTHRFQVDHGIIGDASYTLIYRLRLLPAR